MDQGSLITHAVRDAEDEVYRATSLHPGSFNSAHEGYAVLLEEVEELWDLVKLNPRKEWPEDPEPHAAHRARMREEAIQVAAMALRFVVDVCQ